MAPYTLPKDAVWFITGCSSGIGHALCAHLIKHTSSRIVATARNPSALETLPNSPQLLKLALDVTSSASITAALSATLERFGRIDVVVNNAGYGIMGDTETMGLGQARDVMETNFWGAVRITQLTLPILRDSNVTNGTKGGLIMQITSMGGRLAFAGNAFYHASKFALEGFTEALAKEVLPDWGIHFLCVEPGGVKTRYAETVTAGFDTSARLDVYQNPEMPTNQMLRYKESPDATKNWADPERVAQVLYELVQQGGEWPLRLPLGSDSWGMQRMACEQALEELDAMKELSCSTSGEEQLASIGFLK